MFLFFKHDPTTVKSDIDFKFVKSLIPLTGNINVDIVSLNSIFFKNESTLKQS